MENLSMIGADTGMRHLPMLVFRSCRLKLVLAPMLLVASAFCAQAKDWRGIVPLHSTRSEVERLLGRPTIARNDFATYDLEEQRVSFDYATGCCNDGLGIWNVSQGTVISIVVTPKGGRLKFRDLRVDLTTVKKVRDEHVLNIFHYIDEQEGVRYEVDESDGTVPLIRYFPAKKDDYLRCPVPKKRQLPKRKHANGLAPSIRAPISVVGKEWRGIVPLHSTCADVKRILGVKKCEYPTSTYELPDEKVEISFKEYRCHKKWPFETWNVPIGTVVNIKIGPKNPLKLDDYFGGSAYARKETDVVGMALYSNSDGVSVEAFNEKVSTVIFHPSAKDEYLRCSGFDPSWRARGTIRPPSLFKSFGDVAAPVERKFLDDYLLNLNEYGADAQGYVLVYAGRRTHPGEALQRARRVKDYLVRVRGVRSNRIGIVDGGYREDLEIELHIGAHGMQLPIINPTVHPSKVLFIKTHNQKKNRRSR